MTTLQKIVKKAKEIRKQHPKKYAKWTDYIKAASKQISGLDKVTKSGNKTTVHYTRATPTAKKKTAKKPVQASLFGASKSVGGAVKISGVEPHKGKYFISYTSFGNKHIKYYQTLPVPKELFKGEKGYLYLLVRTDKGSKMVPLMNTKTNKQVKK